jgi:hypothetical protein
MEIFISYAHEDEELIAELRKDLELGGHNIWLDKKIDGGDEWWDEILSRIRSCNLYILAVSGNSIESDPCLIEMHYAQSLQRHFLPVMVRRVNPAFLPAEITHHHLIDYTRPSKEDAFRLSAAISKAAENRDLPDPLPPAPEIPVTPLREAKVLIDGEVELDLASQQKILKVIQKAQKRQMLWEPAVELLNQFLKREDIMARVEDRVEEMLKQFQHLLDGANDAAPIRKERAFPPPSGPPRLATPASDDRLKGK